MAQVGSAFQDLLENLLRVEIPVRVLIAHAAVEAPLRDLVARGPETHVAELLIGGVLCGRRRGQSKRDDRRRDRGKEQVSHVFSSLSKTRRSQAQ